jgi:hypothetical protein
MSRPPRRLQPVQFSALASALWPSSAVGSFRLRVPQNNRPRSGHSRQHGQNQKSSGPSGTWKARQFPCSGRLVGHPDIGRKRRWRPSVRLPQSACQLQQLAKFPERAFWSRAINGVRGDRFCVSSFSYGDCENTVSGKFQSAFEGCRSAFSSATSLPLPEGLPFLLSCRPEEKGTPDSVHDSRCAARDRRDTPPEGRTTRAGASTK